MKFKKMKIQIINIKKITQGITTKVKAFFEIRRCHGCSRNIGIFGNSLLKEIEGVFYCMSCAKANFKICDYCDEVVNRLRTVEGKKVCNNCFINKTFRCPECGIRKLKSHLRNSNGIAITD